MKEKPILFTAPMVMAILDGRKTQTRRVVKHQPTESGLEWVTACDEDFAAWQDPGLLLDEHSEDGGPCQRICPYGQPGERLWVRENWRIGAWDENRPAFALDYCDGPRKEWVSVPDTGADDGELFNRLWKQSTDDAINAGKATDEDGNYHWEIGQSPCRLRPSIFMPRWASRITLEITGVRVERLQDISVKDAVAEGISELVVDLDGTDAYKNLWQSINGPDSWDANPWVWVIEFKRVEDKTE